MKSVERESAAPPKPRRQKSVFSRNPKIQWGAVCIRGTRLTVHSIKGRHRGGDSAEQIAKSHNKPIEVIKAALLYGKKNANN